MRAFGEGSIRTGSEKLARFRHTKMKSSVVRELMGKHAKIIKHEIVQKMKPRTGTSQTETQFQTS